MRALRGTRFESWDALRQALQKLPHPPNTEALASIEQFAEMRRLQLQAQEFSGDQRKGELTFRGDVRGTVPRENLRFTSELLNLVRLELYEKMRSEGQVKVNQWERSLQAGSLFYEQAEVGFEGPDLKGPLRMARFSERFEAESAQGQVTGDLVEFDLERQQVFLRGQDSATPATVLLNLDEVERARLFDALEPVPEPSANPEMVRMKALQATLNNERRRILLEGEVELEKDPEEIRVFGGRIQIDFDALQQVETVYAEREVCVEQPGRVARADYARMNQATQTIMLEGNAEVNSAQYNLKGEAIKLYLDVNRGVAQGDDTSPIQVTIVMDDNAPSANAFRCR
jgi:lipopolysaccharide export system protein LptA